MEIRRRLLMQETGLLPPIYRQVEYIESTGTQWIDTGIVPYTNTKAQIKFMNLAVTGNVIFGYYVDSDSHDWRFFNYTETVYFDQINSRLHTTKNTFPILQNAITEIELGNYYVRDLKNSYLKEGEKSDFVGDNTITLNRYATESTERLSQNRWYYVKIFDGGQMVRNMIPCVRKSDNKPGMYDTVSKTFYTNAGTGEFIVPQ